MYTSPPQFSTPLLPNMMPGVRASLDTGPLVLTPRQELTLSDSHFSDRHKEDTLLEKTVTSVITSCVLPGIYR